MAELTLSFLIFYLWAIIPTMTRDGIQMLNTFVGLASATFPIYTTIFLSLSDTASPIMERALS